MASDYRKKRPKPPVRPASGDVVRQMRSSRRSTPRSTPSSRSRPPRSPPRRAKHVETLDRLAAHLETIDVWTRAERARQARFNRDDIAAAAIRIADTEGFEAVSMRRLAAELDAGTMSLYHYVRTKDELLTLVVDALMGEVVLPADQPMPGDWRAAITSIAERSPRRACAVTRGSSTSPTIPTSGPTRCVTSTSRGRPSRRSTPASRTSSISSPSSTSTCSAICLHERNNLKDDPDDDEMIDYIERPAGRGRVSGAVRDG